MLQGFPVSPVTDRIRQSRSMYLPWTGDSPVMYPPYTCAGEDVPAFGEPESGGPPPGACRVVGVGQPPSHPTKERGPP